jgi:uncharacterized protein
MDGLLLFLKEPILRLIIICQLLKETIVELNKLIEKKIHSVEFHVVRVPGAALAYDVENSNVIEINEVELQVLESVKSKAASKSDILARFPVRLASSINSAIDELFQVNLLTNDSTESLKMKFAEEFNRENLKTLQQKKLMQISLNMTHSCNLNCDYCYGDDGTYGGPPIKMSEVTAFRAIDFLIKENGDAEDFRITLFGGEPLLNFDLVKKVISYVKKEAVKIGKNIHIGLTTNGILLDEEKSNYLLDEGVEVTISLDGPKDVQDVNRPIKKKGGASSYDLVFPQVKRFVKKAEAREGFHGFRATLTGPSMRKISKIIDFFAKFKNSKKVFDIAEYTPGSSRARIEVTDDDLLKYKDFVKEQAKLYGTDQMKEGFNPFVGPLNLLHNKKKKKRPCLSAGVLYLGVSAEGDLFPCHRMVGCKETKLGNLQKGYSRNDWLEKYSRVHVYNSQICSSCWVRYSCGGLCPATSYFLCGEMMLSGDVGFEPIHCRVNKIVFEEAILLFYKMSQQRNVKKNHPMERCHEK